VLQLVLVVGDDLRKLLLHKLRVVRLATDTGKGVHGTLNVATLDEVTWRLREKEEPNGQDDRPQHLNSDWDTVGTGVVAVLGGVVDAGREEQADGNAELVAGDDGTTNLAWGNFRHVQNDDGRDEADAETSDETTGNKKTEGSGDDLEDDSNDEDQASGDDGDTTAEEIREITSDDGAEEGTGGEDRSD